MARKIKCVAIAQWAPGDGIALPLQHELESLAYAVKPFLFDQPIPSGADMVLSFAPYGPLRPLIYRLNQFSKAKKPFYAHWNFEGIPDPRIPATLVRFVAMLRAWSEPDPTASLFRNIIRSRTPLRLLASRMFRYRYLGDYMLAQRTGALDMLIETSDIYAEFFRVCGLQPVVIPWGTSPEVGAAESTSRNTTRDIDVLWMGKRRTRRRSELLDHVRAQLSAQGVKMHVIDGEENPLVYGDDRTRIFCRAKLTLNLLTVRHDWNFPFRFHVAAPNRCMVVSEKQLKHSAVYETGKHYAEVKATQLTSLILRCLCNESEREQVVENAWRLVTEELTLGNSVSRLMDAVSAQQERLRGK